MIGYMKLQGILLSKAVLQYFMLSSRSSTDEVNE